MCKGQMHEFLQALPKCEHHLHLEGTLEPPLLFKLAKENNVALPPPDKDPAFASIDSLLERYKHFTSLDDFLGYYFIGMSSLIKRSDFEALAWEYFVRAKADGVVHAEVFFDPQAHTDRGVEYSTVVDGFTAARKRAESELGITSELIVCILRHLPLESAREMYEQALPDLKSGAVAGLGLSSTEKGNPPKIFKSIYEDAKAAGIRRTAHAGEEADVDYMQDALESLDIQRVDHGIKLPQNPVLMAEYAKRKIMVTMCPLSNIQLKCVKSLAELPIRTYLNNNVKFSINSDDPAYFGGYILANYCGVQEAFQLNAEEWGSIVTASVEGSWCGEARKNEILTLLSTTLAKFA